MSGFEQTEIPMKKLIAVWVVFLGPALMSGPSARAQVAVPSPPSATSKEFVLSGEDWKLGSFEMDEGEKQGVFLPSFDDQAFRKVSVPGEVQRQIGLQDMDLYYQSKTLTQVNEKEWWYRKEFHVSKAESGKLLRLMFDGVDYFASVWLNGEKLGDHEGAYVSFSYDVSKKIHFGQVNILAVKVTCPWIPKDRGFLEYMKGDWTTIDPQNQMHINQAPYFFGPYWDAIPADGNAVFPMGMWRDVRLVSSGFSVIDDLFVSTNSLNTDGSATLAISGTVKNYGDRDVKATLNFKISPDNFAAESLPFPAQTMLLHPGENSITLETTVKNPRLWWTWDTGEPNLYKLTGTLSSEKGFETDIREVLFGIRTISVKTDMSYWLNGKRLFLKGAWYPMSDYYGSKPTRETFLKDLQLLKAANLNHLVAFTVVEKPEFYELCDRLGILEIFEFPFNQDGPVDVLSYANPRREAFVQESLSQVRQILLALRNHPSVIEWAAFAEAHAKGGGWGVGAWSFDQYGYGPYSEAIGKLVAELAPGTIYHPSLCDMGEQHFWMGNAGMGNSDSYNQHFHAQTGFVSEYGSLSLPVLESLKKELAPEDMWSDHPKDLPRWHNLPINVSAYSYLSSFDYDGVASLLDRVNQYVDRHIGSIKDLVDGSQLYQAFVLRYATDAYRRKKYDPINGTRFWDYGEVWPGIRWGIIDYYRVPKMSYYSVKQAQARFALNFEYEQELESQPSGTRLQIPVWIVNDYSKEFSVKLKCQIQDLSGHVVWSKEFFGSVPADGKREMGIVDWVTPETTGVYVLRGEAVAGEDPLQTSASTFIKVTPKLFTRQTNVLLIGQRKYSTPIAEMIRAAGVNVDVIDERSLDDLARLSDSAKIKEKYDVVWLAAFDSFWKFLDDREAEGLKEAIGKGVGFIHTGGRGSFHGGFGEGACLDFTPLAEVLPVNLQSRYDLVLGQADQRTNFFSEFSLINGVRLSHDGEAEWTDGGLSAFGLPGFNETALKPKAREILNVNGHPLLALGEFGQGHVVAFTGFTPAYTQQHAEWDDKLVYPYLLDQELYRNPAAKAYFKLFLQFLAAASGQKPRVTYDSLSAAREKPLFEMLKDLPPAEVNLPESAEVKKSKDEVHLSLQLINGIHFARLVRVRAEWNATPASAPYLVLYDDNYFDLAPGESRAVEATVLLPKESTGPVSGQLIVEGTNVSAKSVSIRTGGKSSR
jgi:beta-mannosidase